MDLWIYINGIEYDAPKIMEEIMNDPPEWKLRGLEFLMQMFDPSASPVKFHTSGTTGTPKEILFSKKQIIYSAENTCNYFNIHKNSNLLLCLPAGYVAGRLMLARVLVSGAKLTWTEPSLNPLKGISKVDFAAFTPAQVSAILNDPDTRSIFDQLKKVIIGGGEISYSLELELKNMHPDMYATYGMTETLTHIAVRKIGEDIYHSIYQDIHLDINEENCLVINLPFISAVPLITSDIVELISPRSFKWKGRKDHVINSGGVKLYPEEMEMKLVSAGILKQGRFYISSQTDDRFGQAPVIVMLKEDNPDDPATFLNRINGLLNKHEAVKAVFIFDKFEYTNNGKLKRQKFN